MKTSPTFNRPRQNRGPGDNSKSTPIYKERLAEDLRVSVALLDIRSRENVGSIFRTSDAAGVSKLYLCGITPRPPHEKISKTALGAEETVPWEYHAQAWRLLERLKKEEHTILMLEQSSHSKNIFFYLSELEKNYSETVRLGELQRTKNEAQIESEKNDLSASVKKDKKEIVLVVGNEVAGISKKLLNYATQVIEIPMKGSKESLNVAVAFGVAVFALTYQKA